MSLKKNVTDYYDCVAGQYDYEFYKKEDPYPPLKFRQKYFLSLIDEEKPEPGAKALDIGCGPGELVFDLSSRNFFTVGMDISSGMIKICRGKQGKFDISTPIFFSVGDIENLPFQENTFDIVTAAGVVEYLSGDSLWTDELYRVLKPGGILILNVTNRLAVRRITTSFIEPMKKNNIIFSMMNYLKENILKRGPLNVFPFQPRTHLPWKLDGILRDKGFVKSSHRYFAFSILPYPFDTLLGFITIPIRKYLERFSSRNMIFWGTGYIVKFRKKSS